MKAYLVTTGLLFALVTVLHVARFEVWRTATTEPMFVAGYALITLLAAALSIWAWRLFVRVPKSSAPPPGERS
jgi:protein-S-isoprenylcysteine O-methyltransferase Ste14